MLNRRSDIMKVDNAEAIKLKVQKIRLGDLAWTLCLTPGGQNFHCNPRGTNGVSDAISI